MPRALGLAFFVKSFRIAKLRGIQQTVEQQSNGSVSVPSATLLPVKDHECRQRTPRCPLAVLCGMMAAVFQCPKYQTTGLLYPMHCGLQKTEDSNGIDIYKLKGRGIMPACAKCWNAIQRKIRDFHTPALFHVEGITQPGEHSTSGSHERYKNGRKGWQGKEWDCVKQMRGGYEQCTGRRSGVDRNWTACCCLCKEMKQQTWEKYITPIKTM